MLWPYRQYTRTAAATINNITHTIHIHALDFLFGPGGLGGGLGGLVAGVGDHL